MMNELNHTECQPELGRRRSSRRRRVVLAFCLVGLVVGHFIFTIFGPQNPKLYFTRSREAEFTAFATLMLNASSYTELRVVRSFGSGHPRITSDGAVSQETRQIVETFLRANRLDQLWVDCNSREVRVTYLLLRVPYCYEMSPKGPQSRLAISARYAKRLGSGWIYFVRDGP